MKKNKFIKDDSINSLRSYSLDRSLLKSRPIMGRAKLTSITKRLNPQYESIKVKCMKKNKYLIYTSNLDIMPKTMADVIEFAERKSKYMIANVELNPCLANVKAGDNIFTKKGNSLYVIRAFDTSLEDMSVEDSRYIEDLTRTGRLKKVNITSVSKIVDFATWCKSAKPLIEEKKESTKTEKMSKKTSIKSMGERIKELFMPTKAEGVRVVATDGSICVETNDGYVAIGANNELVAYPEEFTLDLPVFVVSKPKDQLAVGDVIALAKSYAKVTKIEGDKISGISYTGAGKTIHIIKDALLNQSMVRVVMGLTGVAGGQINPMLLAALGDSDENLLPLLLMSQNNGAVGMNPMMAMLMAKGGNDGFSLKDALMMSAMTGQDLFRVFAAPQAAAPAQPQAPVAE